MRAAGARASAMKPVPGRSSDRQGDRATWCGLRGQRTISRSCGASSAARPAQAPVLPAQVELLDVAALREPFGGAVHHDPPDLHHIAEIRDVERDPDVLLHQQHCDPALPVEPADDGVDVADQNGRQTERRLVQQHDLRTRHEPARDGQHLLLAAGERARGLAKPLLQDREVAEDHRQVLLHAGVRARIRIRRRAISICFSLHTT